MISFQKNIANNVVVTLTENSTVTNPIYLFNFVSQQTLKEYYFIASDISNYKQRYNKFVVTEKPSPNTLSNEVDLGKEGFYDYYIYQTSLANTTGLVTANDAIPFITKEVENGLVDLILNAEAIDEYNEVDNTSIVYQP